MLLVDPRVGSGDLAPVLRTLGVPVDVVQLPFADCTFMGSGYEGAPTPIGIELKRLSDILACVQSGRFAGHQLPGLLASYDHVYLVVEGLWRAHPQTGTLEHHVYGKWCPVGARGRQPWMYRDFTKYLLTLVVRGGVTLWQTGTRDETARFVASLYAWWQEGLEAHTSHLAMDRTTQMALRTRISQERGLNLLGERTEVSLVRRLAAELPGVGLERSAAVAEHFASVRDMVNADESEWKRIPGVGKVLAKRLVESIHNG